MNTKQQGLVEFLEKMVMSRVTEKELNEKLSEYVNEKVEVHNSSQARIDSGEDDDELADYNFMFNIEGEELYGYFDIYMLPTREKDVWYITEIGYEFD